MVKVQFVVFTRDLIVFLTKTYVNASINDSEVITESRHSSFCAEENKKTLDIICGN